MGWSFTSKDIIRVQLEIGNYCNLSCPSCTRSSRAKHNLPLNTEFLSLDVIKKELRRDNLPSIERIVMSGNVEEPTLHPDIESIIEYLCDTFPDALIEISSNASTRDPEFWKRLGELSATKNFRATFAIDGLEDTNQLYRIGSDWDTIVKNFRSYLAVGNTNSVWQCVVFDHNKHQIDEIREFAKAEGFEQIAIRYSGRISRESNTNVMTDANIIENNNIVCKSQFGPSHITPSIFINYSGDVAPCCFQDPHHKHATLANTIKSDPSVFYNIKNNTLSEIVDGEYFELFDKHMATDSLCIKHCKQNHKDISTYHNIRK